jgi:hypothetical protein
MKRVVSVASFALIAIAAGIWIWLFWGSVLIYPDTGTYYHYSWLVPLGYPLFLSTVRWTAGSHVFVPTVQIILLTASACVLVDGVARLLKSASLTLGVTVVLLANTPTFLSAGEAVTEPLYTALLFLNVGVAFRLLACFEKPSTIVLSASSAASIFIRPAGFFTAPAMLYVPLAMRSWRLAAWCLIPLIGFYAGTIVVNQYVRGTDQQSQLGRVLFAQVSLHFDPAYVEEADRELVQAVHQALRPFQSEYSRTDGWLGRYRYSMMTYNARVRAAEAALRPFLEKGVGSNNFRFEQLDPPQLRFFFATVLHNPTGYLRSVTEQLYGAWTEGIFPYRRTTFDYLQGEAAASEGRMQLLARYRLPLTPEQIQVDPAKAQSSIFAPIDQLDLGYWAFRDYLFGGWPMRVWITVVVGVITLFAIPAGLFVRSSHILALGYLGVIIHGSVVLVAMTTVFIARYALPVEPLMLAAALITGHGLLTTAVFYTKGVIAALSTLRLARAG